MFNLGPVKLIHKFNHHRLQHFFLGGRGTQFSSQYCPREFLPMYYCFGAATPFLEPTPKLSLSKYILSEFLRPGPGPLQLFLRSARRTFQVSMTSFKEQISTCVCVCVVVVKGFCSLLHLIFDSVFSVLVHIWISSNELDNLSLFPVIIFLILYVIALIHYFFR